MMFRMNRNERRFGYWLGLCLLAVTLWLLLGAFQDAAAALENVFPV